VCASPCAKVAEKFPDAMKEPELAGKVEAAMALEDPQAQAQAVAEIVPELEQAQATAGSDTSTPGAANDNAAPGGGQETSEPPGGGGSDPPGGGGGHEPPSEIGIKRRISEMKQRYGASADNPAAFEAHMAELEQLAATDPAGAKAQLDAFDELAESHLAGEPAAESQWDQTMAGEEEVVDGVPEEGVPEEGVPEEAPELDLPENQEAMASAEAARDSLPEPRRRGSQVKTVARVEGGEIYESGWADSPGFEGKAELNERVGVEGREGGTENAPHGFDPKNDPGGYGNSHAERQAAVGAPDSPIGVSSDMCPGCQQWFKDLAVSRGTPQIVADPSGTRMFMPDGRVLTR
jgi:hypothetical protein